MSIAILMAPEIEQLSNYPEAIKLSALEQDGVELNQLPLKVFDIYVSIVNAYIVNDEQHDGALKIRKEKNNNYYIISFVAKNSKLAQAGLNERLDYFNLQTRSSLYRAVSSALVQRQAEIQQTLLAAEATLDMRRQQRLHLLESSRRVAVSVGLTGNEMSPVPANIPDDALFMMGIPALNSLIEQAKEWPIDYDEDYYYHHAWLTLLMRFTLKTEEFQAVQVISPPSLPGKQDTPKTGLVLVLSLTLGVILGSAYVLIRQTVKNEINLDI